MLYTVFQFIFFTLPHLVTVVLASGSQIRAYVVTVLYVVPPTVCIR